MSIATKERQTISVYRTAPQAEKKAAAELREHKLRCYVPRETKRTRRSHHSKAVTLSKVVTAPGYVFVKGVKPAWAKHAKGFVGPVIKRELARVYAAVRPKTPPAPPRPFNVGDEVTINVGTFANVSGKIIAQRSRAYLILVPMFGKENTVAVHEAHIQRKTDYG
jgi:transcription antitermination factor NusG